MNRVRSVCQWVPPRAGPVSGVVEFAQALSAELARRGIAAPVEPIEAGSNTALEPAPAAVLLHYVGYGYARDGAPRELVQRIAALARARPRPRLLLHLHEVHAESRNPLSRTFWNVAAQRAVARELLRHADAALTSTERFAAQARALGSAASVRVLPIAATFAVPNAVPTLAGRRRALVVFGAEGLRRRAYALGSTRLLALIDTLGLEAVVDIGPGDAVPLAHRQALPVEIVGRVDSAGLGTHLTGVAFGMIDYFDACLAKSSVFAAYCACGLVPILARDNRSEVEGLMVGREYVLVEGAPRGIVAQQAIADAARAWYAPHALARHADWVERALGT
jgi:hypothetical protein